MNLQTQLKKRKNKLLIFLGVICSVIVLSCLSMFLYHQIMIHQSNKTYSPVGQFIEVGDYRLHYYAMGESNGLPTVILESGSGTPSSYADWRFVMPELAKRTRVITYDRAGYGWSDQANTTRTSEHLIDDLYYMLQAAGESGPFILVGHSFGGLLSQQYADRYPEDVSGMLLIDSSIPGLQPDVTNSQLAITKLLRQLGMMRVMGDLNALPVPDAVLSDDLSRELLYKRFYNNNQISEIKSMANVQLPVDSISDLPITIISAREEENEHPNWQTLQDQFLALSSRSKRLIVEDASHYIHHDQPDIVLHEIYELLSLSVAGEQ